jgi:hypothetical protein
LTMNFNVKRLSLVKSNNVVVIRHYMPFFND